MDEKVKHLKWAENEEVHQAVGLPLATLLVLGHLDEEKLSEHPGEYIREVTELVARAVASMPAVQRAMGCAYPGLSRELAFNQVVGAIAKIFVLDGDALVKKLKPGLVEADPVAPVVGRRKRGVN